MDLFTDTRRSKFNSKLQCCQCYGSKINIQKAILKGKDMNSYFPPEKFVIYGGYNKKKDTYYFKIVYDCDHWEWSMISDEPFQKRNKWVCYMEKYIKENKLLVEKFGLESKDIPKKFKLELDEDLEGSKYSGKNKEYLINLQKEFKHMLSSVKVIENLSNPDYDLLLSKNIVFLNLIDCSAVNTIIECIVRNTPVIVNRLPAVVEYLGKDYPLYYHSLEEVQELLKIKRIKAAHAYLRILDKEFLRIDNFIESLKNSDLYQNL